ncbi:MAG: AAA family ATPase, partial [Brevibacterium sp.]|nr:AAA family ATPase [Brevibacterium sp.]
MTQTPGENSAQPQNPAQSQPAQPQPAQERDPLREAFVDVRTQIAKAVVGQDEAVTGMLIALLCQG